MQRVHQATGTPCPCVIAYLGEDQADRQTRRPSRFRPVLDIRSPLTALLVSVSVVVVLGPHWQIDDDLRLAQEPGQAPYRLHIQRIVRPLRMHRPHRAGRRPLVPTSDSLEQHLGRERRKTELVEVGALLERQRSE
jgi:hypothetical protein